MRAASFPTLGASNATRRGPGATPNPASRIDHFHTDVRNRMLERNIALNATPNTIVAAFAQRKLCDSNSDRSIAGADVRAWWTTNAPSTTSPPTIDATV